MLTSDLRFKNFGPASSSLKEGREGGVGEEKAIRKRRLVVDSGVGMEEMGEAGQRLKEQDIIPSFKV